MSRLGRGLDSLLGAGKPPVSRDDKSDDNDTKQIAVGRLHPGKFQPRRNFNQNELSTLADSVRRHGVIQAIVARARKDGDWEIVAGERRWRAAKIAGLKKVPVITRKLSDKEALFFSLVENIQRADLNPMEQAHGLERLINDLQLTHEKAGDSVGLSRPAVSNLLRLLALADTVQKMLEDGRLEMGHARALLALAKPTQAAAAKKIVAGKLNTRAAEALVKKMLSTGKDNPVSGNGGGNSGDIRVLEKELSSLLAAPVDIQHKKSGGGKISVQYGSLEKLDYLIKKLRS